MIFNTCFFKNKNKTQDSFLWGQMSPLLKTTIAANVTSHLLLGAKYTLNQSSHLVNLISLSRAISLYLLTLLKQIRLYQTIETHLLRDLLTQIYTISWINFPIYHFYYIVTQHKYILQSPTVFSRQQHS